jgi:hypothetical protein
MITKLVDPTNNKSVEVELSCGRSIIIETRNHQAMACGSVVIELCDNKLVAYVWSEQDEGGDPTSQVVIWDNAEEAYNRTYNEHG